jgi:hypothetical protein
MNHFWTSQLGKHNTPKKVGPAQATDGTERRSGSLAFGMGPAVLLVSALWDRSDGAGVGGIGATGLWPLRMEAVALRIFDFRDGSGARELGLGAAVLGILGLQDRSGGAHDLWPPRQELWRWSLGSVASGTTSNDTRGPGLWGRRRLVSSVFGTGATTTRERSEGCLRSRMASARRERR